MKLVIISISCYVLLSLPQNVFNNYIQGKLFPEVLLAHYKVV